MSVRDMTRGSASKETDVIYAVSSGVSEAVSERNVSRTNIMVIE